MNRSELRALALDFLDDPTGAYFNVNGIFNTRINLAYRELQKMLISANKAFYQTCVTTTTVTNQSNYALPSDFYQILTFRYVVQGVGASQNLRDITRITPGQQTMVPYLTGSPQFYYLTKNSNPVGEIILVPTPDQVYTLQMQYSYLVPFMNNDLDTPDVPEEFEEYIAVLAARDGYLKDGRSIAPIEVKLKQLEEAIKQIANQRDSTGPRMIRTTRIDNEGW